jgi:hypothetical protein
LTISKLDYVNIREIWKHEAADFTAWLADNMVNPLHPAGNEETVIGVYNLTC